MAPLYQGSCCACDTALLASSLDADTVQLSLSPSRWTAATWISHYRCCDTYCLTMKEEVGKRRSSHTHPVHVSLWMRQFPSIKFTWMTRAAQDSPTRSVTSNKFSSSPHTTLITPHTSPQTFPQTHTTTTTTTLSHPPHRPHQPPTPYLSHLPSHPTSASRNIHHSQAQTHTQPPQPHAPHQRGATLASDCGVGPCLRRGHAGWECGRWVGKVGRAWV